MHHPENYQNELDVVASRYLLDATSPMAVFSGDDHDYCEVTHHTAEASIRETTCKTFSIAMEVSRPGYQLVALLNPTSTNAATPGSTLQSSLCLLPDQAGLYSRFCKSLVERHQARAD